MRCLLHLLLSFLFGAQVAVFWFIRHSCVLCYFSIIFYLLCSVYGNRDIRLAFILMKIEYNFLYIAFFILKNIDLISFLGRWRKGEKSKSVFYLCLSPPPPPPPGSAPFPFWKKLKLRPEGTSNISNYQRIRIPFEDSLSFPEYLFLKNIMLWDAWMFFTQKEKKQWPY